jgi:aspartyl/asparaginyl beta-hydroxylase (cupin superfamily)
MNNAQIEPLLAEAARARAAGRMDEAEARFRAVLAAAPGHPGALNALGNLALQRGQARDAAEHFAAAAAADPHSPALWINLARARRQLGDDAGERESLEKVLEIDQRQLTALIRLAELHERRGEAGEATARWSAALAVGRTIDGRTPELEAVLAHGARFVESQTRDFAEALERRLGEEIAGLDARDRRRFTACVDHSLGRRSIYHNQCEGLHYPFLPADEFFDRDHFPWFAELEAETETIRAELEALLGSDGAGFEPYVAMAAGTPRSKWTALDHNPAWSALHLWREGRRIDDACERCPRTAAIVERLPRAEMPGRAPTVFFSLLKPRTRIPPHTGVSNTRTIIHLPLIVPPGCGFRVGGETREWRVGEAFAFDDTIEHEAWNDSDELRAVLILDVWNPHLSAEERRLLQQLFAEADARGHSPGTAFGDAG